MDYKIGEMEMRFAELIWENEPVGSGELVKLCQSEFNWKKSTTYTMLKRLIEKGIFKNEKSVVSALISKEEFKANQSEQFIEETFEGSLPKFLTAFTSKNKLTEREIAEIQKFIDESRS
ncbi:BlaI/MecI/CopY family transcriptional regulator [Anaerosphaera multitolerans]|uniref:BlaI/MecI/CopY family transcriptional regulator n=1 Tax=Anaerosphaera multitolerans TaxID=2487351 RepID=A0A437S8T1_9FIRM|nr:BlaI/MecI/CopY family transcriptional regulator [Anaerosphaera multitolerans]RVU55515.1 BlaI/MecI/CopY family transcriptional regulator [Anaerosphaera multitolerans]